jgi:chemotaxis protein CheY-P-specific phosphatase CheC
LTQAAQAADQLKMGWLDEMINQLCGTKSNSLKFFESFKVFFSTPQKIGVSY